MLRRKAAAAQQSPEAPVGEKDPPRPRAPLFWAIPVLSYLAAGLCHLPPLLDADARLVDGGGHVWSASDLRETAAVVMLFTMTPTALMALLRLASPKAANG